MRDTKVDGQLVLASKDAPPVAICPVCEGEVRKRKRRSGDRVTWFWRHVTGVATPLASARVLRETAGREDVLPSPLPVGFGVLAFFDDRLVQ